VKWKSFNNVHGSSGKEMCSTKLNDDISKGKKLISGSVGKTC
jgi:hypothetical protein